MNKNSRKIIEINPAKESIYDPSCHRVVGRSNGPDVMILEVVKNGYIDFIKKEFVPADVIIGKYSSSEQARAIEEGGQNG